MLSGPNLFSQACIDVRYTLQGELFLPDYQYVRNKLKALKMSDALTQDEEKRIRKPMIAFLKTRKEGFETFISNGRQGSQFFKEVAEALMQKAHQFNNQEQHADLMAFQGVASTLHKEMLKKGIAGILERAPFPLARWATTGPYTSILPIPEKYEGPQVTVVKLPVNLRYGGLLAWGAISHEIGGHHLLSSVPNLIQELKQPILPALMSIESLSVEDRELLTSYWSLGVEELASDILGTLNLGPAFGVSLAAHLIGERHTLKTTGLLFHPEMEEIRAIQLTYMEKDCEKNLHIESLHDEITIAPLKGIFGEVFLEDGETSSISFEKKIARAPKKTHPLDALRLYVIKGVSEKIMGQELASDSREAEAFKILESVLLDSCQKNNGIAVSLTKPELKEGQKKTVRAQLNLSYDQASELGRCLAVAMMNYKFPSLADNSFCQLIRWNTNKDSPLVSYLCEKLRDNTQQEMPRIPKELRGAPTKTKSFARHILAAAILETVINPDIEKRSLFAKMKHWLNDSSQVLLAEGFESPNSSESE